MHRTTATRSMPSTSVSLSRSALRSNRPKQSAEDAAARELVLLDKSLGDLSSLTAALSEIGFGVLDRKELAVVGTRDDIVAALSSGLRYDAIHWISHGSAEGLQLGNELLSGDIATDDPVVTALTRALGPDSDLMLYGCDLAAGGASASSGGVDRRGCGGLNRCDRGRG